MREIAKYNNLIPSHHFHDVLPLHEFHSPTPLHSSLIDPNIWASAMDSSLPGQLVSLLENGQHHVWEDQSIIKWRKRDAHVPLRCHESVEGKPLMAFQFQFLIALIFWFSKIDMLNLVFVNFSSRLTDGIVFCWGWLRNGRNIILWFRFTLHFGCCNVRMHFAKLFTVNLRFYTQYIS